MYTRNSLFGMTLVIVLFSSHLVCESASMSDSLSPEIVFETTDDDNNVVEKDDVSSAAKPDENVFDTEKSQNISVDISLNEDDSFFIYKTKVTKADIFCKDGMAFMSEGLREEALANFKIATDLYEDELHNEYIPKDDLIAIRENLKRMSKLLDGSPAESHAESSAKSPEAEDTLIKSPINPTKFPDVKDLGTSTTKQVVDNHKEEPTPAPEIAQTPTPFENKHDFGKAKEGEYWVIESTTMLLRNPELLANATSLLGNLIGGTRPGTTFQIMEIKDSTTGSKWKKVQVYNKGKEAYPKGWILSATVGKASQVEKPD